MSNAACETAKYRDDPVLFAQDFAEGGQMQPYQETMVRLIAEGFHIPAGRLFVQPWRTPPLPVFFPLPKWLKIDLTPRRRSRGWRRHVRRMKAARR